jgi:miniconductance mechanosensitive channel
METIESLLAHAATRSLVGTLVGCLVVLAVAVVAAWLTRYAMVKAMTTLSRKTVWRWDDALVKRHVFRHLAKIVPLLIIKYGATLVSGIPVAVERVVSSITAALIVLFVLMAIGAGLSALEDLYQESPRANERSIKGYVQLIKILVFGIGAIVIMANLIGRSPVTLLAGLGAVSAVLLLIFKDTILSVVASVQLSSNDMIRVGDWIAMPANDVDGDVIEVALHTVKVVNWDKTISTIPTWDLIAKSFRNYRNMYETGRRIRRALNIDFNSVRLLAAEDIDHLRQLELLAPYFKRKDEEIAAHNAELRKKGSAPLNERRLSNFGTFRAYVQAYIGSHPEVNQDLFWAVRQLDPTPTGIPLQVYGYTRNTSFVPHHNVKDDIFEHLITILPEFGLSLFQQPSGADLRAGLLGRGRRTHDDPRLPGGGEPSWRDGEAAS